MAQLSASSLRNLAAIAASLVGVAMVASLWFRPLDETGLWLLLQGGSYLFIALGLFGRASLTLYLGIAAPIIFFALRPEHTAGQAPVADLLALVADATVATLCAAVVWRPHIGNRSTADDAEQ